MMGIYFACTGFGNKLAGSIGESSQLEPFNGSLKANKEMVYSFTKINDFKDKDKNGKKITNTDYAINLDKNFEIRAKVYPNGDDVTFEGYENGQSLDGFFDLTVDEEHNNKAELLAVLAENGVTKENPYHAKLLFEKDGEKIKIEGNKGDGKDYGVSFVLEEQQSAQEYKTFMWITIFTVAFGLLLILFIKRLKKLTHGAEDDERDMSHEEPEGFELADKQ